MKYVVHTSTYYAPFIDRDEEEDSFNGGGESEGGEGGEGEEVMMRARRFPSKVAGWMPTAG